MCAICAVYSIAYTSNLQKHGTFLKYCSKRLCSNVICKHNDVDVRRSLSASVTSCLKHIVYASLKLISLLFVKIIFSNFQ